MWDPIRPRSCQGITWLADESTGNADGQRLRNPNRGAYQQYPQCRRSITVGGPKNADGTVTIHFYEESRGIDVPVIGGYKCFGFGNSFQGLWSMLQEPVTIPYTKSTTSTYNAYMENTCRVSFAFSYSGATAWLIIGPGGFSKDCSMDIQPQPVSCNVTASESIQHRSQNIGTVYSRSTGRIGVECSSATTVTASVSTSGMTLSSGPSTLGSNLYVGADGQIQTRVMASPNAIIPLISTVDATGLTAGSYSGSKVVIIDWE